MDRVELGYSQGRVELSQGKVEGSHIGCSCHLSQKVYICWWEQKKVQIKGTNYLIGATVSHQYLPLHLMPQLPHIFAIQVRKELCQSIDSVNNQHEKTHLVVGL